MPPRASENAMSIDTRPVIDGVREPEPIAQAARAPKASKGHAQQPTEVALA